MTKISLDQKKELTLFFEALEKVKFPSDPREPGKLVYDLGLIVFESPLSPKTGDVYNLFPEGKTRLYKLDNPFDHERFLKELVLANREGQWFLVDCQADPSPTIIGILKQLSEDNAFTAPHFEEKELFRMELNPKTRVIFAIQTDFLETKITYPFFINIFGPIIRI